MEPAFTQAGWQALFVYKLRIPGLQEADDAPA